MTAPPEIVVVGSLNQDLVLRVPRRPRPGETVLATEHLTAAGGKGANQAVAAARLGRAVAMVGRVGDDAAGRALVAGLSAEGIDTTHVSTDPEAATGLAVITVDPGGENAIVVGSGANARLDREAVAAAAPLLAGAAVTLLQLETPLEAVAAAAELTGGRVLLNPAPAHPLDPDLLRHVELLVPNETELAVLAGAPVPDSPAAAARLARRLVGPAGVVVTLGAQGAVLVVGDAEEHVPAPQVDVVDTTAAGDAFCGALADALACGAGYRDAVRWAVQVGAAATTRLGAQPSLPRAADVPPV